MSLNPSTDAEVLAELAPCLQLVAPVGMDMEAQDMWFEAALRALAGLPIDLIRRGAAVALRSADHHSKIVPAIMAEIADDLAVRRRFHAATRPAPRLSEPPRAAIPREETQAILRRVRERFAVQNEEAASGAAGLFGKEA